MMQIPVQHRPERNEWVLQFINIVFLILLFFLVNATIQAPPPQDISPPVSIRSEVTAPPAGALFIDRTGTLFWKDAPTTIQKVTSGSGAKPSALYADKALPARALVRVITELQKAGIRGLPLVTVKSAP